MGPFFPIECEGKGAPSVSVIQQTQSVQNLRERRKREIVYILILYACHFHQLT